MSTKSDYEKLVETVAKEIEFRRYKGGPGNATSEALARAAVTLIRDRLATVTPAMHQAWLNAEPAVGSSEDWLAMLSASPLFPDTPHA